jgi:hypothetical protein
MSTISSLLRTGLKSLPEDTVVPAQSVPNLLKKKGVKDEEVKYSGIKLPTEGKVTKADLLKMEEGRTDVFNTEYASNFNWVSLKPGRNNPTYIEKITTYSDKGAKPSDIPEIKPIKAITREQSEDILAQLNRGAEEGSYRAARASVVDTYGFTDESILDNLHEFGDVDRIIGQVPNASDISDALPGSRYTSGHFENTPNYLMHTRIYDDTLDGVPTRVVQEIQSDLHQAGRQQGYDQQAVTLSSEDQTALNNFINDDSIDTQQVRAILTRENFVEADEADAFQLTELAHNALFDASEDSMRGLAPSSPFEKTWLRKGMEREITDAINEGREQIAIPISGNVSTLIRAPGVQKWYETTVMSTAKKLAKSGGMDFEMKTVGKAGTPITNEQLDIAYDAWYKNNNGDGAGAEELLNRLPEELKSIAISVISRDLGTATLQRKLTNAAARGDQVTYAVLKPSMNDLTPSERIELKMNPGGDDAKAIRSKNTPSFNLYASPAATSFVAYQALSGGMEQDEVEAMLDEEGFDKLEIQDILANTQAIASMKADGFSDEDIRPMLEEEEVEIGGSNEEPTGDLEPMDDNRISDAYRELMGADEMSSEELISKMLVVYPDDSYVTTNIAGFFGDREAQRVSDESRLAQRSRVIVTANAEHGLALEWGDDGEWYTTTEKGREQVTPEWWRAFSEAKIELAGGLTGAYAGFKLGAAAAARTPGHPVLKGAVGLATMLTATSAGAVLGTELDYMHSAMMLQQEFEAGAMARKAMTATELSVIGDLVGGGVIKLGAGSWKGLTNTINYMRDNSLDRAITSLKETFFLTDEEAAEAVAKLSRVATVEGKTASEKAITATALTRPGAEELVEASVGKDPRASRAVVKAVDDRAKDLLANTNKLEGEDVGRFLREDLEGYRTQVRENFERVKTQAAAAPKANAFRFNYDKLAINPVLARLRLNIENKDLAFKFSRQAQRIRNMSKSRRLPDLIELRKLVNEFRYNKRISSQKDYEMLDGIKTGIDKAIELGAEVTMENPKEWLGSWRAANKQYSEMKGLEKNVLAKALSRPGVSEKVIGQALTKYASALDSTFYDVMSQLPKKSRMRAEGAIMNNLAEKYTPGPVEGVKATNFPGLMKDLEGINFTSPEVRSTKKAIGELANVFKNDVPLSHSAGGISVTQFAQALTTDPVMKAKYAIASKMFHFARSMAPGYEGRASSLINKTTKLLENPLNSKTIKELQEMLDGEVNLDVDLENLLKKAAQERADGGGMPRVKLYGDGSTLVGKGPGKEQSIAIHRIAKTEDIKAISEATGILMGDKKGIDQALRERGYIAAQLGAEKVRLLQ